MRRPAAVLASVLALAVVTHAQQPAPPRTPFQELYDAYIAGDAEVVLRSIRSPAHLAAIRGDLLRAAGRWRREFDRRQVALLIEVATVSLRDAWSAPMDLLRAARLILSDRKARIGERPDDDGFELLAHHVAATLLLGAGLPDEVNTYVREVGDRLTTNGAGSSGKLAAPRFLMYPAFVAESRSRPAALRMPADRTTLARAADLYERAMREPLNEAEARIRRGFLLYRMGDLKEAMAALEPPTILLSDKEVEFFRLMVRGKVQEALQQTAEAEEDYRRAARLYPRAQTPLVALSHLLIVRDRAAEAQTLAVAARRQPADADDPWWDYFTGDMRFFNALLHELRRQAAR